MSELEAQGATRTDARELARAAREALVGRTIADKYVLRRLIGQGGMGAVYEAEHLGIGKRVAIKFVDPEFATDDLVVARFDREARAMSRVESAHIVSIFDAGTTEGRPYLVMELLRGEDLGERLRRNHRIPTGEAMHVAAQVLKGLARAHAAGIVHRDLKPDNVFLVKSDLDPLFAKIVDFGVSKIERPRSNTAGLALTGRGTVLGTPFYMSPEQAQAASDVDARADLYSVGAMVFECLSGRPPHTGESYEQVILSICLRDAPDLRALVPSVGQGVAEFVARALSRSREDRFPTAERMLAALHEVAPEERLRVPLDPVPEKARVSAAPDLGATRLGIGTLGTSATPIAGRDTVREPQRVVIAAPDATGETNVEALSLGATGHRPRRVRSAVATAIAATLLGVGVTSAVVSFAGRRHVAAPAPPPMASTIAIPGPMPPPAESTSVTLPIATSAPAIAPPAAASTKPRVAPKPRTPPTVPPKPSARPLDINREDP